MNYEKYLVAAGVPQELHQQALGYMAKCERDYRASRIALHNATAFSNWWYVNFIAHKSVPTDYQAAGS